MCVTWRTKGDDLDPMESLTELVDALAENADVNGERVRWILEQASFKIDNLQDVKFTTPQLQCLLAMARLISRSKESQHVQCRNLLDMLLQFLEVLPLCCSKESFPEWFTFEAASLFFGELNSYLVGIVKSRQMDNVVISSVISTAVGKIVTNHGANSNRELPPSLKAYLSALSNSCPSFDAADVDQISSCLFQEWILPLHGFSKDNVLDKFNIEEASVQSPSKSYLQSPLRESFDYTGKLDSPVSKHGSPSVQSLSLKRLSPMKAETEEQNGFSVATMNGNAVGKGIPDHLALPHRSDATKTQNIIALQEDNHLLEKQGIAFRILAAVLDTVGLDSAGNRNLFHGLIKSAVQQLKAIPSVLKLRKRDWPVEEDVLKPRINVKLQICKAASAIYTKSIQFSNLEGRMLQHAVSEMRTVLIDILDACTMSQWRRLRACEDLFASVLENVTNMIPLCSSQDVKALLRRLRNLILATCAQADPGSTNQGLMFESIVKVTCELINIIWNSERAAIESFLLSLAANARNCTEHVQEENSKQVLTSLNVIQFLADTVVLVRKPEVAEMICPIFVESLEGEASAPSHLRLQLLDAVSRIATLGFEKSYRETVTLLTRSYMEKLSTVGSTQSRTLAPEATAERVETLPIAFRTIASALSQPKLRADYRQRLLQLCSDVGLAAESKSGKSGADLLGPLLPSVAEICSDFDVLGVVEPTLLKLFRNLWFYIAIFALAPPIQKVQTITANVSSSAPSVGSTSAVTLHAVTGPYMWNTEWPAAVICITQGTPPLVGNPLKWMEDELELNELHNPGSRRGSNNEKAASSQRAALCAALKDHIDTSSLNTMSGVKATYFLAVAFLEILRMKHNGGVIKCNTKDKLESALYCAFEYLEKPNLAPSIYQCLVAIVRRSFDAAMAWLECCNGSEGEQKETVVVIHTRFLISRLTHRSENVRDLACGLLEQIKHQFPQVLWSAPCLNDLLRLIQMYNSPSLDPTRVASMQSLIKKQIRNWISKSLILAPCTTQGLLQEWIRSLSTWSSGSYISDLLSLLSDIKLDTSGSVIPALFAASTAAAVARGWITDMGTLEVISNAIVSANVKSSCIHMNIGLQDSTAEILFGNLVPAQIMDHKSENAASVKHILKQRLVSNFLQLLQQFISQVEQGEPIKSEAFRETCLKSAAFIVSESEFSQNVQMDGFLKLLRLLCWCPAYICSHESLSTGIFIWTWLVSAAPHLSTVLLAELVDAWLWTVETGRGLFASGPISSGPHGKLRPHLTPGEPVHSEREDVVGGIIAHRLWLGFFFDRFEVARHNSTDQLSLFGRMLQGSLKRPQLFSSHPAASGTFFSLMLLGLKFCSSQIKTQTMSFVSVSLLEDHVYRCALAWFSTTPEWYDGNLEGFLQEETQSVALFVQQLSSDSSLVGDLSAKSIQEGESISNNNLCSQLDLSHPVWGKSDNHTIAKEKRKQLLQMLCRHELERLEIWANPLRESSPSKLRDVSSERWTELLRTAWLVDPRIALSLPSRFPAAGTLRPEITSLVQAHITDMFDVPEALPYIITPKAAEENSPVLQLLPHWAPCSITKALEFLSPSYKGNPRIMAYVLRVLESYPPECVKFFMPQLVQTLRYHYGELVEGYLLTAAQRSHLFAHLLIWQLQGEEPVSMEEFSKEQQKEEKEFHKTVLKVKDQIIKNFNADALDIFEREFRFFDKVTNVSGALFHLPKEKRRGQIKRELEKIDVEGQDLYLPTAPTMLVRGIQLDSGIPLQSAAKVPIMVTFDVVDSKEPNVLKPQACIFKVGDDCRQDVLALQVISLLRDIFKAVGLNLYLFPYGVIPTGPGKGIVEVVPNTRSRNQMGETNDGGLFEIFQQDFGPVGSPKFEVARDNFVVSSAGYAVASLLLQPKDRHNGNLLFDNEGRLVHIDFGFILETSPGGNLRFESAQFKLSHEMTQLLDPSGVMKSETWNRFVKLCVKGYLAARQHMDAIINTVLLMVDSGLPCFSRGDPIGNLRKRFHPEMTECEAANFMIRTCEDAYNKWSTAGYDLIQYLQQGIEM